MWRLVSIAVVACSGSATLVKQSGSTTTTSETCPIVFAEYEVRWRAALVEELEGAELEPEDIEPILESQVSSLPNRRELSTLHSMYAVVDLLLIESAWPAAFEAAERAIVACGEQAHRP